MPTISINESWNFSLVIGNYKHEESSGYLPLVSVEDDFTSLVESLANKYHYDLSIMRNLLDGNAVVGSTFFEDATYNDFINSKDILRSLNEYLECLQELKTKKNKTLVYSLMFYFLGHGVSWNNQDYLIGSSGKPTSVKQIQKVLQDSHCTKQHTLVLDCCRNVKKIDIEPDMHERSPDINMTVVFGAVEGAVAPDVLG